MLSVIFTILLLNIFLVELHQKIITRLNLNQNHLWSRDKYNVASQEMVWYLGISIFYGRLKKTNETSKNAVEVTFKLQNNHEV